MTNRWTLLIASTLAGLAVAAASITPVSVNSTHELVSAIVEPLSASVSLQLRTPDTVLTGKTAKLELRLENTTGVRLQDVEVHLHVEPAGLLLGENPILTGDLKPGKRAKTVWRIQPTDLGSYVVVATMHASTPHGNFVAVDSDAMILEVVVRKG